MLEARSLCSDCNNPIDGRHKTYCKGCVNRRNKGYRASNPSKARDLESVWRKNNRDKINARHREWTKKNPRPRRGTPEKDRAYALKKKYGLSPEDFDQLWESQKGLCVICGCEMIPFTIGKRGGESRSAVVDHNHDTGKVRGILCRLCNVGLGSFRDNWDLLVSAASYLLDRDFEES